MKKKSNSFFGIHRDLVFNFIFSILLGAILIVIGVTLLLYVQDTYIFEPKPQRLTWQEEYFFNGAGLIPTLLGLLILIIKPFRIIKSSSVVLKNKPRQARVVILKQEWSDSTNYYLEVLSEKKRYLLVSTKLDIDSIVGKELLLDVYSNQNKKPVAVKITTGFLWVV